MTWQEKAKIIYGETRWERSALSAGISMDNQINGKEVKHDVFGIMEGCFRSHFDVRSWLAWFDYDVLKKRGLENKEIQFLINNKTVKHDGII